MPFKRSDSKQQRDFSAKIFKNNKSVSKKKKFPKRNRKNSHNENDSSWNKNLDYLLNNKNANDYILDSKIISKENNENQFKSNFSKRNQEDSKANHAMNGEGDIHSLIRKIKPTTLNSSIVFSSKKFDINKKPKISILRRERLVESSFDFNKNVTKTGILNKDRKGGARKRVKFKENPTIHHVANWKFLNVDMSREGKRYNKFNTKKNRRTMDNRCTVF